MRNENKLNRKYEEKCIMHEIAINTKASNLHQE